MDETPIQGGTGKTQTNTITAAMNILERETETGRVSAEIEKNDSEVHAWVEKQKRLRAEKAAKAPQPIEAQFDQNAARNYAKAEEARSPDTIEREDALASPSAKYKLVPPDVAGKYLQVGDKFHHPHADKAVAFIDRGDKLETSSSSPQMAEDLVKIAEARGWDELRVRGTEGFKREVWLEASVRGIHVDGYKPSDLDRAELERRSTFLRNQNSIEVGSKAFEKLPPSEGVRRDPSLVNAYATVAAAKAFADAKIPDGENREAFVDSVSKSVTKKLENGEPVGSVQLRVPEGKIIERGSANYNFDKDEKPSYYVKLADAKGKERIVWGMGLKKALDDVQAKPGEKVKLKVTESKGVVVEGNLRDGTGKVIGRTTVDSHRNEWKAEVVGREQAQDQKREQYQGRGRSA